MVAPPQPEAAAAGQKGKEGPSKDKKAAAETHKQKGIKQEAKEPAPGVEPAAVEANSLPNGDKSQKRPEKRRQSLGGFFKGLVRSRGASPLGLLGPGCGSRLQRRPAGWPPGGRTCARQALSTRWVPGAESPAPAGGRDADAGRTGGAPFRAGGSSRRLCRVLAHSHVSRKLLKLPSEEMLAPCL